MKFVLKAVWLLHNSNLFIADVITVEHSSSRLFIIIAFLDILKFTFSENRLILKQLPFCVTYFFSLLHAFLKLSYLLYQKWYIYMFLKITAKMNIDSVNCNSRYSILTATSDYHTARRQKAGKKALKTCSPGFQYRASVHLFFLSLPDFVKFDISQYARAFLAGAVARTCVDAVIRRTRRP